LTQEVSIILENQEFSMSISLDTNVVLRLLLGDNVIQSKKALYLIENLQSQAEIADQVFVELEYALVNHYNATRTDVVTAITYIILNPAINCNRELLNFVLKKYVLFPKVSFVDLILAGHATINKALPLYTFDQKLAKQVEGVQLLN
jgi:predicted nucleic-acid-binding protein